jgi:hypothetical protein
MLAIDLVQLGADVCEADIVQWPPWKIRGAYLWIKIRIFGLEPGDPGLFEQHRQPPYDLTQFLLERAAVPSCRVCGCTEDFACPGPAGQGCSWMEPDLCSECWGVEL